MIRAARKAITIAIAGVAMLAEPACAQTPPAADFPGRAVKFVVPGPVGGPTDTLCRLVADKLRQSFGHPVVVENRPGAVGSIGASAVAVAQPTGHTLLCTPDAPITLSPLINKGLSYDPAAFEPVISLAITYSAVAVRRDLPANSIAELIAYAKANPKRLNYATGGSTRLPINEFPLNRTVYLYAVAGRPRPGPATTLMKQLNSADWTHYVN